MDLILFRCRREIGGIGFNEKPVQRNDFYKIAKICSTGFDSQYAGDSDIQSQIKIGFQFLFAAAEAVNHTCSVWCMGIL